MAALAGKPSVTSSSKRWLSGLSSEIEALLGRRTRTISLTMKFSATLGSSVSESKLLMR